MSAPKLNEIYLSSSPHFTSGDTTQTVMLTVLIALLPECVYGVIVFGIRALVTVIVAVTGCIIFEALFQKLTKQKICISNLSAAVTGVMLSLVIPSTAPVWTVILGALTAVVLAKGLFGGIGANVFNPALTGRAVMFISFPAVMGAGWLNIDSGIDKWNYAASGAANLDAVSGATVLSRIKEGGFEADAPLLLSYFLGKRAGCIGETSIILILLSFIFLLVTGTIDWRAPAGMIGTVALSVFISSAIELHDAAAALKDVLVSVLTGGLIFGAVFMSTDYATTPVTKNGRLVFGAGCGLITFLIRRFGGYPEGVMFSILIMNSLTPFLNNLIAPKYGYGKKARSVASIIIENINGNGASK